MKQKNRGSVLLLVLFVLTTFTLWAATLWRETTYMIEIAFAKQRYEQQFHLTEALLHYGIAAAKVMYKTWLNNTSLHQSIMCSFDEWPPLQKSQSLSHDTYAGKITIKQHKKEIVVLAQLFKKNDVLFALRAVLSELEPEKGASVENDQPLFIIKEWSIDAH